LAQVALVEAATVSKHGVLPMSLLFLLFSNERTFCKNLTLAPIWQQEQKYEYDGNANF